MVVLRGLTQALVMVPVGAAAALAAAGVWTAVAGDAYVQRAGLSLLLVAALLVLAG